MKRFKSVRDPQRFLSAFSGISGHFRPRQHRLSATQWRTEIDERFAVWREVTAIVTALVEIPQVCSLKFLTCEQRSV